MEQTLTKVGTALWQQMEARGNRQSKAPASSGGLKATTPIARRESAMAEMLADMSRMKDRLSSADSSGVSGGVRRVLTPPTRGAFAMRAKAHN
jgi:hypothetical protein